MATKLFNWVREHTVTTGTGNVTLAGAEGGYVAFTDHPSISNGTQVRYTIEDSNLNKEEGIGTWQTGNILVRTTVLQTLVAGTFDDSSPVAITLSGDAFVMCIGTSESLLTSDQFGTATTEVCEGDDSRLSDDRVPLSHDNTKHSDVFWHAGNDGSGSGLDADELDGVEAFQFLRSDITDIITATLFTFNPNSGSNTTFEIGRQGVSNVVLIDFHSGAVNVDYDSRISATSGDGTIGQGTIETIAANIILNGDITVDTGHVLTLDSDPTSALHAATKQYVDVAASETVDGVIELATQTEVDAKTDALRAITPNKLAGRTLNEWVLFNGTGTPAIIDDVGITSVTDTATGKFDVNFSTTKSNTNFAIMGSGNQFSTSNTIIGVGAVTTGDVEIITQDDNGIERDITRVSVGVINT